MVRSLECLQTPPWSLFQGENRPQLERALQSPVGLHLVGRVTKAVREVPMRPKYLPPLGTIYPESRLNPWRRSLARWYGGNGGGPSPVGEKRSLCLSQRLMQLVGKTLESFLELDKLPGLKLNLVIGKVGLNELDKLKSDTNSLSGQNR